MLTYQLHITVTSPSTVGFNYIPLPAVALSCSIHAVDMAQSESIVTSADHDLDL